MSSVSMKSASKQNTESAHDILRAREHPLKVFFAPQIVAVIGATEAAGSVGRLSKVHGTNEAEVAMVVADEFQHRGLGNYLLRRLIEVARDEKLHRIVADILPENREMQRLCEKLGFWLSYATGDAVRALIEL